MDLGINTNIESVGVTDVDLKFTIQGTGYRASKLLYDLGADTATGGGTRVFEVIDQRTKKVRVIKDCWVEDRAQKRMEHEIVVGIKQDVNNDEDFHKHFINICGYRRTDTSGGFDKLLKGLNTGTFEKVDLQPRDIRKSVYCASAEDRAPNQGGYLLQTPAERAPPILPCPRFRYQVVYDEKGVSLFEVPSFADIFVHIVQAADGMSQPIPDSQIHSHRASTAQFTQSWVGTQRLYARECYYNRDDGKDLGL